MDVFAAIQGRRSIRQYDTRPVEDEKLNRVLEAARLSPSANNSQSWKFIAVRDAETRAMLAEAAGGQMFIKQAPVVIVACGLNPDKIMSCGQHRYTVDLSIATAYMILQAYELGLGTCWLGHYDEKRVKEILGVPESVRIVAMTPLGYPSENPAPRPRKDFTDVVCYERYS